MAASSTNPRRSERPRKKTSYSAPPCSHAKDQASCTETCGKSITVPITGYAKQQRKPVATSSTGLNKDNKANVVKRVVGRKRTKKTKTSVTCIHGTSKEGLVDKQACRKKVISSRSTPEKSKDATNRPRSQSTITRGRKQDKHLRSRSCSNGIRSSGKGDKPIRLGSPSSRRRGSSGDRATRSGSPSRSKKGRRCSGLSRCKSPSKSACKKLANLHIVEYLQDRIRAIPVPNRPVPNTMSVKVLARELKLRLASTCLPFRETGRRGGKVKVTVVPQRDRVVPFYVMTLDQDPVQVGEEKIVVPKWTSLVQKGG